MPCRRKHCSKCNSRLFKKALKCLCRHEYDHRNIDGSNNNESSPDNGKACIQLIRLAPACYEDDISTLRIGPNPREISNEIFDQTSPTQNEKNASAMFWIWGQFIDHDLDLTPGHVPEEPAPIDVPTGDAHFDPGSEGDKQIPFNRSIYDETTGTGPGNPREQLTKITSYLDGSGIYGSSEERNNYIRKFKCGLLKETHGRLPPANDGNYDNANGGGENGAMYLCGDVRANEHVGLLIHHIIWIREHNYWARLIKKCKPCLSDERIYQKARVMVESEIQHITYNEFLPLLLGEDAIPEYGGYDDSVDATVSNEFSTAAFRLGHSMVSAGVKQLDKCGNSIVEEDLALRDVFFSPYIVCNSESIEPFIRGYAADYSEIIDSLVIDDLRNFLFGPPGSGGLDLVALNIQRGRDHGLPTLNKFRYAVGLPQYTSYTQITSDVDIQTKLDDLYNSFGGVDGIDLWVGGLVEDKVAGSQLGETFQYIIVEQFKRTRDGDRFWYENRLRCCTKKLIKNTKWSDIIKRNTDICKLQDYVMVQQDRECCKCCKSCKC